MKTSDIPHIKPGDLLSATTQNALIDGARRSISGDGVAESSVGWAIINRRRPAGAIAALFRICKVTAVHADRFECKDIVLATGAVIGDPFDVWPIVYQGGIIVDYDLTIDEGDGMIHPRLRVNSRLRVCTTSDQHSLEDGIAPESRVYAFDPFYVTCAPDEEPPP